MGLLLLKSVYSIEYENFNKASEQGNNGAKFASIAKIGGNAALVFLSGRQMHIIRQAVVEVITKPNVSWCMALASRATVLARLNLWMIVATAIVIIGGLAYEMLNPSKLILWVKHSIWGIDNRSWDFPTTQQKLAEVVLRPRLEVKAGIQHISQATGQFSYKTTQTYLKHCLSCFGITPSRFAQVLQIHQYHPLALCIIVLVDGKWINKTDEILETADFTVLEQGLRIDYDWPTYLVKKISRTEWTIAVTPDIAVEPLDKAYQFIRYSTQGTTVTEMEENDRLTTQGQYPLIAISDDYITMGQTND
ncbi:hypothetical protein H0A36_28440 [Endozoicomonas sp. SM1973]|uniref:Uncharacterized protein n=1 Tax=Spartinivicinus marinus TaxID=2994442 RepID=A0A853IKQ7_9GAMM|nr:hypothetical protein [Spartinivicinus marinus]MCX4025822.1 hypothetical protein [Spartinivicinus marinus]NYZ69947.1 hypothetical protein [Spartinivicinus marinus]